MSRQINRGRRPCQALVLLAALGAGGVALAHEGHAPLPTKGATVEGERVLLSSAAAQAIGLQIQEIRLGNLSRLLRVNATIEAPWQQQAYVTTLVSGRIERVLVGPDEPVEAGQALAYIASPELEALQLDLTRAAEELRLAEATLARQQSLADAGAVRGRNALDARAVRDQRIAEVQIARRRLASLGLDESLLDGIETGTSPLLRSLPLRSPLAGVVAATDVNPGQHIEPNIHLYHVVDLSHVWAVGQVLEGNAAWLRPGLRTATRFDALPGRKLTGRIDEIDLKLAEDRTLAVRVRLENDDRLLRPGMAGRMAIEVERVEQGIVCPLTAIVEVHGSAYVFVQNGTGRFERQLVELGLRSGRRVEIRDGVFPGDRVVTSGSHLLAQLLPDPSAAPSTEPLAASTEHVLSTASRTVQLLRAQAQVEIPPDRETVATSGVQGRIARVLVDRGADVRAGQVLAEVESLALEQAQLDLLRDRAELLRVAAAVERLQALESVIARRELLELESRQATLVQSIAGLRRQLELQGLGEEDLARLDVLDPARDDLSELRGAALVRASAAGRIVELDLALGQVVRPDDHLFELHDDSLVWVRAWLYPDDGARVRRGQKVRVRVVADPAFEATSQVTRIAPLLSGDLHRLFSVWVAVENPDGRLKEGMSATVEIEVAALPADVAAGTAAAKDP
jgi:RND family efflux transporter MFP subunit